MANNLGVYNQQIGDAAFTNAGEAGGSVKVLIETVEASSLAADTALNLSKKFGGQIKVIDAKIVHDALGTGVTLKLGDTSDDDAIIVASAAATAGTLTIAIDQMDTDLAGTNLVLTTGGATATGTIKVVVYYVNI